MGRRGFRLPGWRQRRCRKAYARYVHPDDAARLGHAIEAATSSGQTFAAEYRVRWSDDSFRWVSGQGIVIGTNREPRRMVGAIAEISERKLLERQRLELAERRSSEERFLSNVSELLADIQDSAQALQSFVQLATERFCDWCLVDCFDGQGRLQRLASAHRDPALSPEIAKVPARFPVTGESASINARVAQTGRAELHAVYPQDVLDALCQQPQNRRIVELIQPRSFIAVPLVVRAKILGVIGFGRGGDAAIAFDQDAFALAGNVALRVAVCLDNASMFSDLRAADRFKDSLLATLAHELRNPLGAISNSVFLMEHATTDPDTLTRVIPILRRQTAQMRRLVDDLMDTSRLRENPIEVTRAPTDLNVIIQDALEMVLPKLEEKGLRLEKRLPSGPVKLDADHGRLVQTLVNLLDNACKFTEAGGWLRLAVEAGASELSVSIQDSGEGIDPAEFERIFEQFAQVHGDRPGQSGLGIGLTLSRSIVHAHGGRIAVSSQGRGSGTTFTVHLPRRPAT
ncbi:MAG: ATP-binding protein [Burkholderiaceae bacterium]